MPANAGLFDCTVAAQSGAGYAMHRCPPALALADGVPQPVGTVLLNQQHLAYSRFDHDHWPWPKFEQRLKPLLRDQEVLDITEGNEIPWWLCLAHTVHLHDIIHEGILQVKAKWQNRTLVLTVATTRRRCCVWYERETREFITETLDEQTSMQIDESIERLRRQTADPLPIQHGDGVCWQGDGGMP